MSNLTACQFFNIPTDPSAPQTHIPLSYKCVNNEIKQLSLRTQLLLTLMKLRQNLDHKDLAFRFNICLQSVSTLINSWVDYMYDSLGKLSIWPHRDVISENMPAKFKEEFPNTFAILDCTELKIQRPSSLVFQSQTYSIYKSTNTLKSLVACDPRGAVIYVSALFTGAISDKEIFNECNILDILKGYIQCIFDHVDWDMFRAASDDDIEAYSDSVTCFIRKCVENVVPTKTIRIYPNQKPWINSDVRAALSARTSAFKSWNFDDRKQASYDLRKSIKAAKRQYKNKVEEQFNTNNARSMWQGINNITVCKGNKPATVNIAASLPDELNLFYARFEAHNPAHTESSLLRSHTESSTLAVAEEVSAISISVADVTDPSNG